jgi:hypothetical protein
MFDIWNIHIYIYIYNVKAVYFGMFFSANVGVRVLKFALKRDNYYEQ